MFACFVGECSAGVASFLRNAVIRSSSRCAKLCCPPQEVGDIVSPARTCFAVPPALYPAISAGQAVQAANWHEMTCMYTGKATRLKLLRVHITEIEIMRLALTTMQRDTAMRGNVSCENPFTHCRAISTMRAWARVHLALVGDDTDFPVMRLHRALFCKLASPCLEPMITINNPASNNGAARTVEMLGMPWNPSMYP
jgi:hypothetical protein